MKFLDPGNDRADVIVAVTEILSALQYDGPEIQSIAPVRAFQDLFFRQPVTIDVVVVSSQTAVEAVVAAVIRKLNKVFLARLYRYSLPSFERSRRIEMNRRNSALDKAFSRLSLSASSLNSCMDVILAFRK